jgi:hypothetical protein
MREDLDSIPSTTEEKEEKNRLLNIPSVAGNYLLGYLFSFQNLSFV